MKRAIVLAGMTAVLGVVVGCGGGTTKSDQLMQDRIKATNELADLLGELKDPAKAKEADPKIKAVRDRMASLDKELAAQPKDQQTEAAKKHGLELTKAEGRVLAATGAAVLPGLGELGKEVGKEIGKGIDKAAKDAAKEIGAGLDKATKDIGKDFGKDFGKDLGKDFGKDFGKDIGKDIGKDFGKDFPKDFPKP